jgi:transposase
MRALIRERLDHIEFRHRRGRLPIFDARQYRRRSVIERWVGWFKQALAVATRFEKLAVHYWGTIKLVMIRCHLRLALSNTI